MPEILGYLSLVLMAAGFYFLELSDYGPRDSCSKTMAVLGRLCFAGYFLTSLMSVGIGVYVQDPGFEKFGHGWSVLSKTF